jgi:hypothetical protein
MSAEPVFQPDRVIAALNEAGIDYVVVGGLAVAADGVVRATRDIDIVPDGDKPNIDQLARCLASLGGEHPIEGRLTGTALARLSFKVTTKHGVCRSSTACTACRRSKRCAGTRSASRLLRTQLHPCAHSPTYGR